MDSMDTYSAVEGGEEGIESLSLERMIERVWGRQWIIEPNVLSKIEVNRVRCIIAPAKPHSHHNSDSNNIDNDNDSFNNFNNHRNNHSNFNSNSFPYHRIGKDENQNILGDDTREEDNLSDSEERSHSQGYPHRLNQTNTYTTTTSTFTSTTTTTTTTTTTSFTPPSPNMDIADNSPNVEEIGIETATENQRVEDFEHKPLDSLLSPNDFLRLEYEMRTATHANNKPTFVHCFISTPCLRMAQVLHIPLSTPTPLFTLQDIGREDNKVKMLNVPLLERFGHIMGIHDMFRALCVLFSRVVVSVKVPRGSMGVWGREADDDDEYSNSNNNDDTDLTIRLNIDKYSKLFLS
eukprot:TRINITY_DN4865_c0_g1_i2.p1 TRINITY_DN4865_c0_g1~~TRINITY_DN4865_c0_g1_i2.p1  ORF type:complete len:349 (+),score=76.07 TRINITY_DN4865_c0_g1_i2:799-1845(+)